MTKKIIRTIFPRKREIVATTLIGLLVSLLIFVTTTFFSPVVAFYGSLLLFAVGINCLYYLLRKEGLVPLFFVVVGLATRSLDDFGIFGWKKVLVLLLSGLVFDFLALFFHRQSVDRSPILTVAFSVACIPGLVVLIISSTLTMASLFQISNLVFVSFLVGLLTSVVVSLIWFRIRSLKSVIRLEMYLKS